MKEQLLGWVFSGYKRRLEQDYEDKNRLFKASVDVKDIVRERLKGVNPKRPDENMASLMTLVASFETPERLDFLSKAYTVSENATLTTVIDYLMTECMRKTTLEATDIIDMNFQRATINGLMLLEEELSNLAGMYLEEKKLQEIMTPDERLSAL